MSSAQHVEEGIELAPSALLDAAPDALVIVDATGIVRRVNRQTEQLFGHSREDLLGRPVEFLMPERCETARSAITSRSPLTASWR